MAEVEPKNGRVRDEAEAEVQVQVQVVAEADIWPVSEVESRLIEDEFDHWTELKNISGRGQLETELSHRASA